MNPLRWSVMDRHEKRQAIEDGVRAGKSSTQIARDLKCGRGAIIGFAWRHDIDLLTQTDGMRAARNNSHLALRSWWAVREARP